MEYSLFVSTLYYLSACFYLIFGAYTIASNAKSSNNRLFLLLTSTMAVWAFTYSVSNSAPTAELSAFWRCMSVFGWGVFHSLLLHFALIITNHRFQLNKASRVIILYLPTFINIILFAPFGYLAEKQYEMVPSDFGWRNLLPANIGQIWINVYYITYTIITIILLLRWWKKIEPHSPLKRQVGYFLVSMLLPFIVGSITDIFPGMLGLRQLPRLTIPLLVLPTTFMFIILRKSGVLLERVSMKFLPSSDTSVEEGRLRLFETASAIFTIGAAGSFYSGYFMAGKSLTNELSLALVVLILGISLRFLPYVTKKHIIQDSLFLLISTAGMTFFIIANIDTGAVTVWAVYIVFLVYTVVLNSDIHAFLFLGATLITQAVLGIIHPRVYVIIDISQYFRRIFIITLSYVAVRYLTNEYASKLEAYKSFAREREILEAISTNLIQVNSDNAAKKVYEMLEMSVEVLGFDHAYLIGFSEDYEDANVFSVYTKSFESEPLPYLPGMKLKTSALPFAEAIIAEATPIICEDIENALPGECRGARNSLLARGINSFYALPLTMEDEEEKRIDGMLVIEYYDRSKENLRESRSYFLNMIVNMLRDSRKKVIYEEQLYNFAYFDEATKLANRNMLKKSLEQAIYGKKEFNKIAILDIKLLNIRMIKDTFGYAVGEQIIVKSAAILVDLLEKCCDIARTGEGDFVVVLPDVVNTGQIEGFVNKILDSFSEPISTEIEIAELFVIAGVGVSVYPDDGTDADTLLKNADLAGYIAKDADNKIVFYADKLESNIAENTLLTNKLFKSLQNEEFSLEFQPQISCDTEKTVGVEALLRWTTDDNKRVAPDRFIPILEQTGLIYDVGLWVLKQALREHNRLVEKGFSPLRFSINLSVVQFRKKDFILDISKLIVESKVDPKYIELEITESMLSENPAEVIEKLYQLKELGISIAIDDFGKGYSSLHRLDLIPFDRIKIDKSIIDDVILKRKKVVIVKTIVSMAKALMAGITAEGVETKEQLDFMKSMDCDEIQGYYYSRPLSAEALEKFLKKE